MAESYHLKEIIELEFVSPHLKSLQKFVWNQLKSKYANPSFAHHPLAEMAIWNAALQLENPLTNHDGSER